MGRRFSVKPIRLRDAAYEMHIQSRQADQAGDEIRDIMRVLRGMSEMKDVCGVLGRISDDVRLESRMLDGISDATLRISACYSKAEDEAYTNGDRSMRRFPMRRVALWKVEPAKIDKRWMTLLR